MYFVLFSVGLINYVKCMSLIKSSLHKEAGIVIYINKSARSEKSWGVGNKLKLSVIIGFWQTFAAPLYQKSVDCGL